MGWREVAPERLIMIKKGKEKEAIRNRVLDIVNDFEDKLQTKPDLSNIWATLDEDAQQDILECCVGVLLEEFGY